MADVKIAGLLKIMIFSMFLGVFLSGCTVSIMLTSSHGTDNDVDSTPTTEAKTDANLSVPAVP